MPTATRKRPTKPEPTTAPPAADALPAVDAPIGEVDAFILRERERNRERGYPPGKNDPQLKLEVRSLKTRIADLEKQLDATRKASSAVLFPRDQVRYPHAQQEAVRQRQALDFRASGLVGELKTAQKRLDTLRGVLLVGWSRPDPIPEPPAEREAKSVWL